MTVLYLDTETTIKNVGDNAVGKFSASPFHPDNRIVYTGYMWEGDSRVSTYKGLPDFSETPPRYLVAQNIAFDLHYLMRDQYYGQDWINWCRTGCIWDVMIAEYLLTGQDVKWANLDYLATKYGGTVKDSRIKEYWEAGVCTSEIPEEEIIPYLEGDVANLRIIFKAQVAEADRLGMRNLLISQMQARLATIMMEFHGMYFDLQLAYEEKKRLVPVKDAAEREIIEWMSERSGALPEELNANSNAHLSACLFGTPLKVTRSVPSLDAEGNKQYYKGGARKGELKTKKAIVEILPEKILEPTRKLTSQGIHPVADDVLQKIDHPIVKKVLKYRELTKQVSTYFDGYSSLVWEDGRIHGQLNHCQTNTGRLSSSNPNLQNISNKESKDAM